MNLVRVGFAIVVIVAFGIFAYYLVVHADTTNQTEWERWVYVFGAIEAIAFAAVGWVFGREVNRERAEKAEDRAQTAEQEKVAEHDKGAKLAGMVVGGAGGAQGRRRLEEQGASGEGLASAVEYAKRAYDL
jgi:hypothetical protein